MDEEKSWWILVDDHPTSCAHPRATHLCCVRGRHRLQVAYLIYVPGDDIMHFTDSCRFPISSDFTFTALCTILLHWGLEGGGWTLKPFMYSVGDVPGLIPGADLSETWTT